MSIMEEQAPDLARRVEEAVAAAATRQTIPAPPAIVSADDAGFNLDDDSVVPVQEGVTKVQFRDRSGKPRFYTKDGVSFPVTVTVHNSYSELAQRVEAQMRRERVRGRVTYETLFKRQMHKLVQCTTGWDGIVDGKGNPAPFSRARIEEEYKRNPFLRKDALEALEDEDGADFFDTP